MSSLTGESGRMGPGVPYHSFMGAVWGMIAFALVFIVIRIYSRFQGPRRLYWDDGFVLFAFLLALITAALWQWNAPNMYLILNTAAAGIASPSLSGGTGVISPEELAQFLEMQKQWLKVCLTIELFFYTSLTSVKLAFLFFFKRLGHNVNKFRYIWWPNVAITLIVWFVCIGNVQYECLVGPIEKLNGWCNTKPAIDFTTATLQANCVLDVFSDLLIIIIPITLLWNIRMKWPKKLAFMILFSLSVVTMAIAIVRAVDITKQKWATGQNDPTYLWLWSAIEPCIAISVSCLSAFPQLFVQSPHTTKPQFTPSETYQRMMSRIRARRQGNSSNSESLFDLTSVSRSRNFDYIRAPDPETASQESRVPVLAPAAPTQVTASYNRPSHTTKLGPDNSITQEREFYITHERDRARRQTTG